MKNYLRYSLLILPLILTSCGVNSSSSSSEIVEPMSKITVNYNDGSEPQVIEVKDKEEVIQKMYLDMNYWLPYDILLKADKMTMANSLELRVPFLDKEVFKMSSKIPTKYLVNEGTTKYAFRKAAYEKIPEEWSKRKKMGFLVPIREWLREEKYYNLVHDMFNREWVSEFFNIDKINKLLDDHYNNIKNNQRKIYTIYAFLVWYNEYFIER